MTYLLIARVESEFKRERTGAVHRVLGLSLDVIDTFQMSFCVQARREEKKIMLVERERWKKK